MIILVAGVSGVTKSTSITKFIGQNNSFVRISASSLIASAGAPLHLSSASQVERNQKVLLENIEILGPSFSHKTWLLDGHVVLETDDGPLFVPDWVFDALDPAKIIVMVDNPKNIFKRRSKRTGIYATASYLELRKIQEMEVSAGRRHARRLKCGFTVVQAGSSEKFAEAILKSQVQPTTT